MIEHFETWLRGHERISTLLLLMAGLAVRLWAARGTFLNPDEALHFLVANKTSWALAYKASLTTAHPPLLIFVLHFWRTLGTSEFVLRLPSIIAGTAFCWVMFRWMTLLFGRTVGWIALVLVTFLPPLIALSAEVRQYTLLLFFIVAALWFVERALLETSAGLMFVAYVCVLLGMGTHYSALLFVAALGAYSFLRIMRGGYPSGLKAAWAAGQFAVLALFGFLYTTHLAILHSGAAITNQAWLNNSFYHRGQQNLFLFIFARTFGVFQFVFGQLAVGDVAGILFVVGMVYLVRKSPTQRLRPASYADDSGTAQAVPFPSTEGMSSPTIVLLLLLPFVLTCAAAIADVYPFGGTRHSAFLIPFAIAGVSLGLASLVKEKAELGIAAALAMVAVSALFGVPHRPYMTRQDQSTENMSRAMTFLRQNVPAEGVILVDYQTSLLLGHYLCEQKPMVFDRSLPGYLIFRCGGYRVLSTGPEIAIFDNNSFLGGKIRSAMQEAFPLKPGEPFWVMQAGWDIDLATQLQRSAQFRDLDVKWFGRNINIFRIGPGPQGTVLVP